MRIALGGIMHESNSFVSLPTGLEAFQRRRSVGDEILAAWRETHHEMAGFIQGAAEHGFEAYPTLMASATPAGPVTAEAFESLTAELARRVREVPALDGMLLAVHGAMVSEEFPDGDGEIIRRVREALPAGLPLVVTLDFHANVSAKMVEHCSAIVAYKTNPHIDQKRRGLQAADLITRIASGEVQPVQVLAKPPMVWNILHQHTRADPLRIILEDAAEAEDSPGILAVSVLAGYPYADVAEMGPSVVVVADGNRDLAQREAGRLGKRMWEARDRIRIELPGPAEAVARAMRAPRGPVVVVEMGDNIGGGSPGDGTAILAELASQQARAAVSVIYDPESARTCAAAGIGATVNLNVGGKTDRLHGDPVEITGRVRTLNDGRFYDPEPRHGGVTNYDQGLTGVVETGAGLLVVVNSRRCAPMSLQQIKSVGLAPELLRTVVVKAAIAYRAAYEPVAAEIIEADTPGVTAVNPLSFEYRHVRRPLWPLTA